MLVLIVLMLFGVAVVAVASVALVRAPRATEARKDRKVQDLGSEGGEREVYERLYGNRSTTVSRAVPIEPPPEADVDDPRAGPGE